MKLTEAQQRMLRHMQTKHGMIYSGVFAERTERSLFNAGLTRNYRGAGHKATIHLTDAGRAWLAENPITPTPEVHLKDAP